MAANRRLALLLSFLLAITVLFAPLSSAANVGSNLRRELQKEKDTAPKSEAGVPAANENHSSAESFKVLKENGRIETREGEAKAVGGGNPQDFDELKK